MSENSKLTATLKAGQGFDSPWIVVYADTVAELTQLVADVAQQGADTYIANAAKEFQAKYAVASGGLAPQQVSSTPAAPAPVAAPVAAPVPTPAPSGSGAEETVYDRYQNAWTYNHPAAPQCGHGVAYGLKAGKNKAGKDYKGWFCTKAGPKPVNLQGEACNASFNGVPK